MENLNAEQIIRALECCANGGWCIRDGCPLYKDDEFGDIEKCTSELSKNALALIKSQDQRIAELTEENERSMREKTALECVVSTARNQAKADTVRKMRELVRKKIKKTDWLNGRAVYVEIDKIAKDILEESDET